MNDKIQFRAWDEKQKYMAYQGDPDLETLQSFIHHFGDKELMRYTGLKDKNGKKIYESDITNNGIIRFGQINEVNSIGFYLESHFSRNVFGELFRFTTPFEVIGNIRENPELLKNA
jgi:hypothetical protein